MDALLRANRLLGDLDAPEIQVIKEAMKLVRFQDNDTIISEEDDEKADTYFMLVSGTVRVFSWRTGPNPIRDYVTPGDGFGELALIHDAPRSASCIAVGDVECYALDKTAFQQVLLDVDELSEGGFSESHSMEMRLNSGLECLPDFMHEGGFARRRVRNKKVIEMYHPQLHRADNWKSSHSHLAGFGRAFAQLDAIPTRVGVGYQHSIQQHQLAGLRAMARSTGRLPVLAGKSALMYPSTTSMPKLAVRTTASSRKRTNNARRRMQGLFEQEGLAPPPYVGSAQQSFSSSHSSANMW
jgi:CRP-like cAMP-binding protein